MEGRSFFLTFVSVVIFLLIAISTMSYLVDPGHIFSENYEEKIVDILISGHNAANVENYDERAFERILITKYPYNVNIAVLGSSRVMEIRDSFFEDNITLLNNGVSGASIEDFIAIIWIYYHKGNLPDSIIIGLDPWILNKNNEQNRWKSLKNEYYNGCDLLGLDLSMGVESFQMSFLHDFNNYISLISRDIFYKSVTALIQGKNSEIYATDKIVQNSVGMRLMDGSISYPEKIVNQSIDDIDKEALKWAQSNPIYSLGSFITLDENNKLKFEKMIEFLQENNINIIFYLPAYHPLVYKEFTDSVRYKKVIETENYYKKFAQERGISIVGSYNPAIDKLSSQDFMDGMHPNENGTKKGIEIAMGSILRGKNINNSKSVD